MSVLLNAFAAREQRFATDIEFFSARVDRLTLMAEIAEIGLDIAKSVIQVHG
jgi:hypothetical protein